MKPDQGNTISTKVSSIFSLHERWIGSINAAMTLSQKTKTKITFMQNNDFQSDVLASA